MRIKGRVDQKRGNGGDVCGRGGEGRRDNKSRKRKQTQGGGEKKQKVQGRTEERD